MIDNKLDEKQADAVRSARGIPFDFVLSDLSVNEIRPALDALIEEKGLPAQLHGPIRSTVDQYVAVVLPAMPTRATSRYDIVITGDYREGDRGLLALVVSVDCYPVEVDTVDAEDAEDATADA